MLEIQFEGKGRKQTLNTNKNPLMLIKFFNFYIVRLLQIKSFEKFENLNSCKHDQQNKTKDKYILVHKRLHACLFHEERCKKVGGFRCSRIVSLNSWHPS